MNRSLTLLLLFWGVLASAEPTSLKELIQRLKREQQLELIHQRERLERFRRNLSERERLLHELEREVARERAKGRELSARFEANEKRLTELEARWQEEAGEIGELFALVRQNGRAVYGLLQGSPVNLQYPERLTFLKGLMQEGHRASFEEIRRLWHILLDEIAEAGRVVALKTAVVLPSGEAVERRVVRVGVFNLFSEGFYLRYLPEDGRLVQPVQQPPSRYLKLAKALEQAREGWHPVALDPTKGNLLSLLALRPDWRERLRQGGVLGYLILLVGAVGLGIVAVRWLLLRLEERHLERQRRSEKALPDNPIGRLRQVLEQHAGADSETLALILDDVTQQEIHRLQRGLPMLSLLATIAPLLGLLGTVTGMIETFDAIALFGTGDPRLMSSGISEALVTTQLGLAVAIPLMLLYSLLRSRIERIAAVILKESAELLEFYSHAQRGGRGDPR